MPTEVRDVAPGLWIWRVEHPAWRPGVEWEPTVTSTYVESRGETLVLDPLAPPADATEVWARLDERPPSSVVVLKPDHVRDVDLLVRRYGARAFGPWLFWRDDIPETDLEAIEPGSELPGGLRALDDGRGRNETPLWLPEQRALVFADALTAPRGDLRMWATPHEERALVALRALLDLPFEHVIVSHGEPLHDRAAYERAPSFRSGAGEASRLSRRSQARGAGYGAGETSRRVRRAPVRDESEGQLDTPDARAEGSVAAEEAADPPSERERLQEGEQRGTSAGPFEPDATSAGAEPSA